MLSNKLTSTGTGSYNLINKVITIEGRHGTTENSFLSKFIHGMFQCFQSGNCAQNKAINRLSTTVQHRSWSSEMCHLDSGVQFVAFQCRALCL